MMMVMVGELAFMMESVLGVLEINNFWPCSSMLQSWCALDGAPSRNGENSIVDACLPLVSVGVILRTVFTIYMALSRSRLDLLFG